MRKVSIDAIFGFSGDAAARLLGFLASVHLARSLGSSAFGVTVVATSVLSYAFWLSDFGLATIGTREVAKPPGAREFEPSEILLTKGIIAAAIFLVFEGVALIGYHGSPVQPVLQLYLLTLFPYAFLIEWYFQGIRNFRLVAISRFLSGAVYLGGLLLLVKSPEDVRMVPTVFLASNLLTAAWLLPFRRKEDRLLPRSLGLARPVEAIRRAVHIGLGGAFAQVIQSLPPVVVEWLYTPADAGILGVAMKGVFFLLMVDRVFVAVFLPLMAQLSSRPKEELETMLGSIYRLVMAGIFTLCALATIFASAILRILFGAEYASGGPVLAIVSWFGAATVVNSFFAYGLIAIGQERRYFRTMMRGSVVSTALILGLTYLWGLRGTAVSVVAGESTIMILMYTEFKRYFRVPVLAPTGTMALVVTAVIAAGATLGLGAVWQAPLVGLLLLLLALATRVVRRSDILLAVRR